MNMCLKRYVSVSFWCRDARIIQFCGGKREERWFQLCFSRCRPAVLSALTSSTIFVSNQPPLHTHAHAVGGWAASLFLFRNLLRRAIDNPCAPLFIIVRAFISYTKCEAPLRSFFVGRNNNAAADWEIKFARGF